MAFFVSSFFWLAGVPITANLIRNKTDYLPASVFCGCAAMLAAFLFLVSRHLKARKVGTIWV